MKKLFPFLIVFIFTFNAFSNIALGDICLKKEETTKSIANDMSDTDDMPCHDQPKKEDKKKKNKDCDGTCMCINICQNHINKIYITENIFILLTIPENLHINDELMSSIILSPPYKPPKAIS